MWCDQVANVRIHETTRERPVDRFEKERSLLHSLPTFPYDTDEIVPAVVTPHAGIEFDGNVIRYHQPWHAGPLAFAPTVTKFASCTRAIWQLSTSAATSEGN